MSFFRILWLRRFIRRHSSPIPEERAQMWKNRFSVLYAVFAWNACGLIGYLVYQGKGDWAKTHGLVDSDTMNLSPAQQWTKTLRIKDATVYRVKGFNVEKYEVHNKFEDEIIPSEDDD